MGSGEDERRGNNARYDGNTGAGLVSGLVCRRCALSGRSGPGWAAGCDEGCGHQSGFSRPVPTLHDGHAGARGSDEKDDELAAWTDPRDRDMEA